MLLIPFGAPDCFVSADTEAGFRSVIVLPLAIGIYEVVGSVILYCDLIPVDGRFLTEAKGGEGYDDSLIVFGYRRIYNI